METVVDAPNSTPPEVRRRDKPVLCVYFFRYFPRNVRRPQISNHLKLGLQPESEVFCLLSLSILSTPLLTQVSGPVKNRKRRW